jgi:cytochrome c553
MNRGGLFFFSLFCAAGAAAQQGTERARIDFLLHCSGCHRQDGTGNPEQGIPNLVGQIGHFQRLPEGREFVVQVPGMLSAGLPDDRAAAVANYMTRRYAGDSLPADFRPYTADEAKRARETRPADILAKRAAIYRKLLRRGFAIK